MIFYPNGYFNKVSEISFEYLKQNNIKGLILDVDNTLIDYYRNMSDDTINWAKELKQNGIQMCILSNSNKRDKIEEVANKLEIEKYSYFAKKPLKMGFKKAQKRLGLNTEEIAVIGDQIFTDVIGANRMKMYSILVEPIQEKDMFVTLIKRPIENAIKRKYMQEEHSTNVRNNQSTCKMEKIDINHNVASSTSGKKENKRDNREEK